MLASSAPPCCSAALRRRRRAPAAQLRVAVLSENAAVEAASSLVSRRAFSAAALLLAASPAVAADVAPVAAAPSTQPVAAASDASRPDERLESGAVAGEAWSVVVPSSFVREEVSPTLVPGPTTIGARPSALPGFGPAPPANPLKARFSGPGGVSVSVAVRRAADLRPTFMQVTDVSQYGDVDASSPIFVPPRSKLLRSWTSEASSPDDAPARSYYNYEFEVRGTRNVISASARAGRVYVVAASAPSGAPGSQEELSGRLAKIAQSFRVVG